ncbi:hypothetical protein C1H76_4467 [Elsinoe australis]|uniref:Rhodopsin domain-containing protein n=1 Tax=Elsinoe australis TaxID=40998 RepID=A0A4U7AYI9_9PEZI|nr:hypothetical protein C1H76_4467 [Elsinoe australis]
MPAILVERSHAVGSPEYNAEDNSGKILTFLGVTGGLALLVVMLRIYVRQFMLRFTGADDITMIFAMFFGVAVFVCFCGESQNGLGRHMTVITPDDLQSFAHWSFYHNLFVLAGICLAKVSICLLLIRLVKHRGYVWFLWALLIFLALYHIACELTVIFACVPTRALWDQSAMATAKCINLRVFTVLGVVNSAINIFTDVLLALLPIPVILSMQLNKRTKAALSFVMLLGFIAVGAGSVKLKWQLVYFSDPDRMFRNRFPIWAAIELYFAILAASLPTLKPLLAKALSATKSSLEESSNANRRANKRRTRLQDDYSGANKSNTFYSECTTALGTPEPGASKDVGSYFSFFKNGDTWTRTERSRNASVQLDTIAVREREVHPASLRGMESEESLASRRGDRSQSVSPEASSSYIVRTRKVTTSSEPVDQVVVTTGKPTGKRRSQSVSIIGRREEEWASVKPLHVRKQSSREAGVMFEMVRHSEEELPRGSAESVQELVRRS